MIEDFKKSLLLSQYTNLAVRIVARGEESKKKLKARGVTPGKIKSTVTKRSSGSSKRVTTDAQGTVLRTEETVKTPEGVKAKKIVFYSDVQEEPVNPTTAQELASVRQRSAELMAKGYEYDFGTGKKVVNPERRKQYLNSIGAYENFSQDNNVLTPEGERRLVRTNQIIYFGGESNEETIRRKAQQAYNEQVLNSGLKSHGRSRISSKRDSIVDVSSSSVVRSEDVEEVRGLLPETASRVREKVGSFLSGNVKISNIVTGRKDIGTKPEKTFLDVVYPARPPSWKVRESKLQRKLTLMNQKNPLKESDLRSALVTDAFIITGASSKVASKILRYSAAPVVGWRGTKGIVKKDPDALADSVLLGAGELVPALGRGGRYVIDNPIRGKKGAVYRGQYRVSPKSKAQLRKESFGYQSKVQKGSKAGFDLLKGETVVKTRDPVAKQFYEAQLGTKVKELRVRRDVLTGKGRSLEIIPKPKGDIFQIIYKDTSYKANKPMTPLSKTFTQDSVPVGEQYMVRKYPKQFKEYKQSLKTLRLNDQKQFFKGDPALSRYSTQQLLQGKGVVRSNLEEGFYSESPLNNRLTGGFRKIGAREVAVNRLRARREELINSRYVAQRNRFFSELKDAELPTFERSPIKIKSVSREVFAEPTTRFSGSYASWLKGLQGLGYSAGSRYDSSYKGLFAGAYDNSYLVSSRYDSSYKKDSGIKSIQSIVLDKKFYKPYNNKIISSSFYDGGYRSPSLPSINNSKPPKTVEELFSKNMIRSPKTVENKDFKLPKIPVLKNKNNKGYGVEVRSKGTFKSAGTFGELSKAAGKGLEITEGTSAASLRVRDLSTNQLVDVSGYLGGRYRASKKDPLVFVEKKQYRISTGGEKMQITAKGIAASKKQRSGFF